MSNNWALVLAAGNGSRLRSLTTTAAGVAIPKQFCSLRGGASLLEETLRRARRAVAHPGRTLTVVAAQHRQWWDPPLRALLAENVIVQPENKGTAIGLLLPLVHLVQRDPHATVLILPSDHSVSKQAVLIRAMHQSVRLAGVDPRHIYLLGLTPEEVDPELGYIVPRADGAVSLASPVRLFVEKPPVEMARRLIQAGALCNAFILAASVRTLIGLYSGRYPDLLAQLTAAAAQDAARVREPLAAQALYPQLPSLDFSRDVLEGQEPLLRVLRVPPCGWSDLGTPRRVAEALGRMGAARTAEVTRTAHLSLADQRFPESCLS
jgi:mannose-1-phosphate guanylyltransferase